MMIMLDVDEWRAPSFIFTNRKHTMIVTVTVGTGLQEPERTPFFYAI